MRIESVTLKNFPPFTDATIPFPERSDQNQGGEVHLLTGQNGSGKTRLLCLLAAACGDSTEITARTQGHTAWQAVVVGCQDSFGAIWANHHRTTLWYSEKIGSQVVEQLLSLNKLPKNQFGQTDSLINYRSMAPLDQAPPTRAFAFRGMARVSDAKISAMNPVKFENPSQDLLFEPSAGQDLVIGQSMANIKMSAAMEALNRTNGKLTRAMRMAQRLESAISKITNRDFKFSVAPNPQVHLKVYWDGVAMWLRQLPDGLRSIIGWLVACVAKLDAIYPEHEDPLSLPLILLLDEPESHLHPAWQRKVLPAAQAMFPQAQIFVATHSPFVISSVNDGWIHIFRANDEGVVTVDQPRPCSRGDTFLDVIEDILGVKEWYDPESEDLLTKFRDTRDAALAGQVEKEPELVQQAQAIAQRSDSLSDLMAREMRQFERQKAQAATGS